MQCKRCKKHFDYEKYYGICPNCAFFNRPDGRDAMELLEEEDRSRFDWVDTYTEPTMNQTHEQLHKQYDSSKQVHKKTTTAQPKKKAGNSLLAKLIILVIAVCIFLSVFGAAATKIVSFVQEQVTEVFPDETGQKKELMTDAALSVEEYQAGDEISLGTSGTITLDSVNELSMPGLAAMLPAGEKLISIHASWYMDAEKSREFSLEYFYLKTENLYRKQVQFDSDEEAGKLAETLGITPVDGYTISWNDISNSEGEICFVVPEDMTQIIVCFPVKDEQLNGETVRMCQVALTM